MDKYSRIFVAGHRGMVGSAIVRQLEASGYQHIVVADRKALNLVSQADVDTFFQKERPQYVFLAAAKVGGILANNNYPADFIYDNLMIEANIIQAAHTVSVERLLFLGSSCIYPKLSKQPMQEAELLAGYLEGTNEPYAVAKIAGIKLCESYNRQYNCDFRSIMPTNLYGPGDNFHPEHSHVVPALIRRIHEAKQIGSKTMTIWGTGTPKREFLHVDDLAAASLFIMGLDHNVLTSHTKPTCSHINVGTGEEISILDLAYLISDVIGYEGYFTNDTSKPDGAPRKLTDISLLKILGWSSNIPLQEGLRDAYNWFLNNQDCYRSY